MPNGLTTSKPAMLGLAAALLLAVVLATYLQGFGIWLAQTWTGENLVLRFRTRLFEHLQLMSLSYHDRKGTSDSVYRVQYDAMSPQAAVLNGLIPLISSFVTVAAMLFVTAEIDWVLATIALAICPALFGLTIAFGEPLRRTWLKVKAEESQAMGVMQEVLGAIRVVKAFGQERTESQRFVRHLGLAVREYMKLARMHGAFDLSVGLVIGIGTAAILVLGVQKVQSGALTLGELLIVMGYIAQLYRPLETISKKITELQSALASAERAFALFDEAPAVIEREDARPLERARGAVTFDHVSFSYGRAPVLDNVSLDVPAGARVGIFGASGAGKSTLVSLLTRFYDPSSGAIRLDGLDLRELRLADLRRQFAIVLQEPVLFSTTIAENIAYGRPGATEEEIVAAARAANADDFIRTLPDGYATAVGERGVMMSGGQRQRVAIARAFLKEAPVLILDEPTSSVDVVAEQQIKQAMQRLMEGRTTFVIAHRETMLAGCDMWVQLSGGRVVATGKGIAPIAHGLQALG